MNDIKREDSAAYDPDQHADASPFGAFAIYCEDVRLEASHQRTYVGVYGSEIFVPDYPSILTQFTVHAVAWASHANPFKYAIFRLLQNSKVLHEQHFDIEADKAAYEASREKDGLVNEYNSTARMAINYSVRVAPLLVAEEINLRVRVETDFGELRAGGIVISKRSA